MASNLDFDTQDILLEYENRYAKKFKYNVIRQLDPRTRHYLLLTSLPFTFKDVDIDLKSLWPVKCNVCKTVLQRKFMPTGNLRPLVMVVGDAPSAFGGGFSAIAETGFGRVWVDKQTSILLRTALNTLDIHRFAWYTNLLKCSVPGNRPSSSNEIINCSRHIENELKLLKPKLVILLGRHVADNWRYDIKSVSVYHPSFAVRSGWSYKMYAKHIHKKLEGVGYENIVRNAAVCV